MGKLFLFTILLLADIARSQVSLNIHPALLPHLDPSLAPFYHGVASGDPTEKSVVIWTKITLDTSISSATVTYEIATDSLFKNPVKKAAAQTDEKSDFTIKERISGLKEWTTYFYRFSYNGVFSITGTTKTLPSNPSSYSIAFVSCSNYEWGYFTNYRSIAENKNIDLVVHLGDYIYEYGVGVYGDTNLQTRKNVPEYEIISLNDYRTRYSLYRLDKDLMKLHQKKPMITTWDDHEIANNAFMEGAENHQKNEGKWSDRKAAAVKAYYEWLPIQPKLNEPLYRSFSVGSLINLIVLDTRIEERTEQVDNATVANYFDSTRTILGKHQLNWLEKNLETKHTWKLICNQVPLGPMYSPTELKKEKYMDGWDGYPFEREKLLHFLSANHILNTVFVTGDYHRAIAVETDMNGTKETSDNVAVELIINSITSANDDEYYSKTEAQKRKERYLENNPQMKYCNNTENGYLVLNITKENVEADYVLITTIKNQTGTTYSDQKFRIDTGKPVLIKE